MKSFEELYNEFNNNKQELESIDRVKRERKKRKKITLIICLIVNFIIIAIYMFFFREIKFRIYTIGFYIIPVIFINLIIMVITTIIFSKKYREFVPIFKEQIIKNLIDNFFTDLEYFPKKEMPREIYKEGHYESYDNYYSDDYIEAKIGEKNFIDIAEVHTEREETYRDSDGNRHTRTYTIFHGIFAKIIMEKSINSNLRITHNFSFHKDKLEMDSSEFEKKFDVFASNKIIGMQLLTPDIMEEILTFKNKTKQEFDIYINENNIYLRFHCGAMFEPKLSKKEILNKKSLETYYNILKFVYELSNKLIKVIDETEI